MQSRTPLARIVGNNQWMASVESCRHFQVCPLSVPDISVIPKTESIYLLQLTSYVKTPNSAFHARHMDVRLSKGVFTCLSFSALAAYASIPPEPLMLPRHPCHFAATFISETHASSSSSSPTCIVPLFNFYFIRRAYAPS